MGLGRSTCEVAAKVFSGEWLMSVLNYSGVISAIVLVVNFIRGCKQWSRANRAEKRQKIEALIVALNPLYARLSHIDGMCIELMEGNDPILRTRICGLIDDANYTDAILECLSAIDNLSLDVLNYSPETIKSLEPLRVWLGNIADRFTFNPSMLDESKMHNEIKDFGEIVDKVISRFAEELYGFWTRERGRVVLYRKLGV